MTDALSWLWWVITTVAGFIWTLVWFLVGGWVSTLLQIGLLVAVIYYFKYGWRQAPAEVWRRSAGFGRFFWSWIRAREGPQGVSSSETVRIIRAKEFGDINVSTLLSILMLGGLLAVSNL